MAPAPLVSTKRPAAPSSKPSTGTANAVFHTAGSGRDARAGAAPAVTQSSPRVGISHESRCICCDGPLDPAKRSGASSRQGGGVGTPTPPTGSASAADAVAAATGNVLQKGVPLCERCTGIGVVTTEQEALLILRNALSLFTSLGLYFPSNCFKDYFYVKKLPVPAEDLLTPEQCVPIILVEFAHFEPNFRHQASEYQYGRCECRGAVVDPSTSPASDRRWQEGIMLVKGLPRPLFGSLLAHELLHAYMWVHGFPRMDSRLEEGLCNCMGAAFLSRRHNFIANVLADSVMRITEADKNILGSERDVCRTLLVKMETSNHPHYGHGYRNARDAIIRVGWVHALLHVKIANRLPPPLPSKQNATMANNITGGLRNSYSREPSHVRRPRGTPQQHVTAGKMNPTPVARATTATAAAGRGGGRIVSPTTTNKATRSATGLALNSPNTTNATTTNTAFGGGAPPSIMRQSLGCSSKPPKFSCGAISESTADTTAAPNLS
eukprot:GHVU01108158.1.p1 GENE.GHVU01108158.1~~GHVU01108158.1.p1  ORF type:complete len:494 (+),score=34.77 GHVU01108158.1:336-1817(+)